ncbi:SDR family NAD(P)-dependent oxidoreductase [uncultured Hyphomonas sp.]|uniref:SDR family NAD(P)-dependent oxidoreductase n=1 Tax=uncultured Hyphomonas sp. TaxID=225298 RepID=UPI002AAC3C01|nr:SDR family NAD(P)-dependent oxidoreductase [uncultured Hyphomonas sp.]
MQAIVFGASGGIGAELVSQLSNRTGIRRLHAVSRTGVTASRKVVAHTADITAETDLAHLAADLKNEDDIRLVIIASGILSDGSALQPEKSYRQQTMQAFERVFRVNTFGPALVARYILPLMSRSGRAVFSALSARVGSIGDNRLGGWHAYRASKAALNMLLRNYAIEQARRNPEFIVAGLHPGTVDTGLSKPFQNNVPDGRLFTPKVSAAHLLSVIDGLTPADSGKCFDWAGTEIPA